MVTKVLLTLLVIVLAYLYLRRRMNRNTPQRPRVKTEPVSSDTPVKTIAILFVLVSFTLTVGFFVYRWIDGNQLLRVTLISPQSSEPLYYQVHKSELQERSFTTTDGQIIRIGGQDRLQIETVAD
ncbi:hypothetical protein [uncultured Amphritea sp.]|uniref:hypothetical protein n=1 Tax=uncultured Amphritea sp. TaxID=981605 RepID=UPI0026066661|nr:hypothetical protein [uncultured Amphritea sp.]